MHVVRVRVPDNVMLTTYNTGAWVLKLTDENFGDSTERLTDMGDIFVGDSIRQIADMQHLGCCNLVELAMMRHHLSLD